jgi:SAM-dependent methyltransferase
MPPPNSQSYVDHVAQLERLLSRDAALSKAVGGEFIALGKLEYHLLRSLGLSEWHLVVDVGCGSGRLASQLAAFPGLRYVGCDVVPRLIEHAGRLCARPDWRFEVTTGTAIPCGDGAADFVCFFSVFTHLTHVETFRYLREAQRVLRLGGHVVMSFLEFGVPGHWREFAACVDDTRDDAHLNQFVSRDAIEAWATHAGFVVAAIHAGDSPYIPLPEEVRFDSGAVMRGSGSLGQSVAVLRKTKELGPEPLSPPATLQAGTFDPPVI